MLVSAPAVAVPVRFLTEFHASPHARKLDPMVTIALVERGKGVVTHRQGMHETRTGDVVIFEPEAEFRYTPVRPQRISMMLVEQAFLLDTFAWRYAPRSPAGRARIRALVSTAGFPVIVVRPSPPDARRLERLLRTARREQAQRSGSAMREEVPRLLTILSQIMEILDPLVMRDHPDPLFAAKIHSTAGLWFPTARHTGVQRALEFVATAPVGEWSVTALAREALLSPGYFTQVFTAEVGVPPRQFLSELRLSEFVMLVQTTTLTVNQAARAVGWASTSHAIAAFRHRFGVTPQEYRYGLHRNAGNSVIVPGEQLIPPPSVEPGPS